MELLCNLIYTVMNDDWVRVMVDCQWCRLHMHMDRRIIGLNVDRRSLGSDVDGIGPCINVDWVQLNGVYRRWLRQSSAVRPTGKVNWCVGHVSQLSQIQKIEMIHNWLPLQRRICRHLRATVLLLILRRSIADYLLIMEYFGSVHEVLVVDQLVSVNIFFGVVWSHLCCCFLSVFSKEKLLTILYKFVENLRGKDKFLNDYNIFVSLNIQIIGIMEII